MKKNFTGVLFALIFPLLLSNTSWAADKLLIRKLVFADDIGGMGQFVPRSTSRFTLDDQCMVYIEFEGFAIPLTPGTQDQFNVNLAVDAKVKLPQSGRKIAFQSDIATFQTTLQSKLDAHYLGFGFSFKDWTPGNYVLEVGIRDVLGGHTVSQDLPFQVVEPTEADIKARKAREEQQKEAVQDASSAQPQGEKSTPK